MQKFYPYRFILISIFSFFAWFGASGQAPTLTIAKTIPSTPFPICKGQQVTFVATLANSNNFPTCGAEATYTIQTGYKWTVNGNSAPGNGNEFTTQSLVAGDIVRCSFYHTRVCGTIYTTLNTYSVDYHSNSITISTKQGADLGNILNITSPTDNSLLTNKLNTFRVLDLSGMPAGTYFPFTLSWSVPSNLGAIVGSTNSYKADIKLSEVAANGTITFNTNHNDCPAAQYPLGVVTKTINITTYNTPPTAPTNLMAVQNTSQNQIQLNWTASTDNVIVVRYKVFYKEINTITPHDTVRTTTNSAALTNLADGKTYEIFVKAYDNDTQSFESPQSDKITFTYDITPPSAPINLSLISRTSRKTFFLWNNGGDNVATTAYDIYVNNVLVGADIASTTYSLTNPVLPTNETFFTISIKAKDAKGNISQASAGLQVDKVPPINTDEVTGYVGIGVVPPTERLHVAGNLKIEDGTLLFKGTPPLGTHIKAEVGDLKIGSNIRLDKQIANSFHEINYKGDGIKINKIQLNEQGAEELKNQIELTQWGEFKFNSVPILNWHALRLTNSGDYNNSIVHSSAFDTPFAGVTNYEGPLIYGKNGGALGSSTANEPWKTGGQNVALKWDATGKVGIGVTGALTEKLEVNGNAKITGRLLIGNVAPLSGVDINDYVLAVKGKIVTQKIISKVDAWSDIVFDEQYKLLTLEEVEKFILKNKHLPEVPSEKEVLTKGIDLAEMNAILLKKVEELTLHVIELNKKINANSK